MHFQTQPTKEDLMESKLEQLVKHTRLLEQRLRLVRLEQAAARQARNFAQNLIRHDYSLQKAKEIREK